METHDNHLEMVLPKLAVKKDAAHGHLQILCAWQSRLQQGTPDDRSAKSAQRRWGLDDGETQHQARMKESQGLSMIVQYGEWSLVWLMMAKLIFGLFREIVSVMVHEWSRNKISDRWCHQQIQPTNELPCQSNNKREKIPSYCMPHERHQNHQQDFAACRHRSRLVSFNCGVLLAGGTATRSCRVHSSGRHDGFLKIMVGLLQGIKIIGDYSG